MTNGWYDMDTEEEKKIAQQFNDALSVGSMKLGLAFARCVLDRRSCDMTEEERKKGKNKLHQMEIDASTQDWEV